ncbi:MAG: hypothetical protein R3E88_11540 [Myxococcota bacterium]|nr:hypothetical protein [Myxococcales bacterium]
MRSERSDGAGQRGLRARSAAGKWAAAGALALASVVVAAPIARADAGEFGAEEEAGVEGADVGAHGETGSAEALPPSIPDESGAEGDEDGE